MFRLGYKVGSDASRIAVRADDHSFGRSSQEFDGAIEGHEFLGCGYVSVARTDDLIHARNLFSSISEGGDGMRPSDPIELAHAEECRRRHASLGRTRIRDPT